MSEPLAPDDPRHGTRNGYTNLGCRCEPCRRANSEYWRIDSHIRGRHAPQETLRRHGISRYRAGCRCEICRGASAAQKRRYRTSHPEKVVEENRRARAHRLHAL